MILYLKLCLLVLGISAVTFLITFFIMPRLIRRAIQTGFIDIPDSRKIHTIPTPRLGGMGIFPAYWISCSFVLLMIGASSMLSPFRSILSPNMPVFSSAVLGFFIGSIGMFIVGLTDDIRRLKANEKLIGQAIVALLCIKFLPIPDTIFGFPVVNEVAEILFFLWLVIVPNSVNLLDGIDGLTGTLVLVFMFCVSLIGALHAEIGWLAVLLPISASIIAFLRFNWNPARIFLGDGGSLLLGFSVAYLSLYSGIEAVGTDGTGNAKMNLNFIVTASLAGIWLIDTFLAIVRRYLGSRPGIRILLRRSIVRYFQLQSFAVRRILQPDRLHIHHRLLNFGLPCARTVVIIVALAAIPMMIGVLSSESMIDGHLLSIAQWTRIAMMSGLVGLTVYTINFFFTQLTRKPSLDKQDSEAEKQIAA